MEPTNENGEPRGSGTERELVAELPVGERNTFSADDLPRDDEKEFKDLMAVVTDLQREVGHNWKLRDALQEEAGNRPHPAPGGRGLADCPHPGSGAS